MRKFFICAVLLYVMNFNCCEVCSIDDRREAQPLPAERHQTPQDTQATRPILPPVVPPSSFGASPTLSPNISAPVVTQIPINIPATRPDMQFPRVPINSIPSVPVYSASPVTRAPTKLPQIPIIGNSLGRVLNIGTDKDLKAMEGSIKSKSNMIPVDEKKDVLPSED